MSDKKTFSEIFIDTIDSEGISLEKLASMSNVPIRFLLSIKNNELSKLPSEPYVRGYILKISSVLNIDPDTLLKAYKNTRVVRSGEKDKLPENRFKKIKISKSLVGILILLIAVIGFLTIRFNEVVGTPTADIFVPEFTQNQIILIQGSIRVGDKLTLNQEMVYTDETGAFSKEEYLEPGLNILEFKIKRFLGRERTVIKQVIYQPQTQ